MDRWTIGLLGIHYSNDPTLHQSKTPFCLPAHLGQENGCGDGDVERLLAHMRDVTSFCLSPAQRMSELGEAPEQASAAAAACMATFGRHETKKGATQ